MNQDQKSRNPQQQKPQADREQQGGQTGMAHQGNRDQQGNRAQQSPQQGNREQQGARGQGAPQGGQGNRDQMSQGRQGKNLGNKGSINFDNEGSQQKVGNDKLIDKDEEVERGNDLDDVSGEITERNPRQGNTDVEKDRR